MVVLMAANTITLVNEKQILLEGWYHRKVKSENKLWKATQQA